ncbi:MAG: hypothetical protein RLP14_01215 [Owenweeksia sp.]
MNNRIRTITTFLLCMTYLTHGQKKLSEDILINKTFDSFIDTLKTWDKFNQVDTFYFNDPTYKSEEVWNADRLNFKEERLDTVINRVPVVFTSLDTYWIAKLRKPKECYYIDYQIQSIQTNKIIVSYQIGKMEFEKRFLRKSKALRTVFHPWYQFEVETTEDLKEKLK